MSTIAMTNAAAVALMPSCCIRTVCAGSARFTKQTMPTMIAMSAQLCLESRIDIRNSFFL